MPFVVLASGITIWAFFSAVELVLTDVNTISWITPLTYVGITIVPTGWMAFALQYTGRDKWMNRRTLLLLTIEPILIQIFVRTNDYHHMFWTLREQVNIDGFLAIDNSYGWMFWAHAVYSYSLLAIGIVLLLRAFIRSPQLYRGQIIYLTIASFTPWVANAVYIAGG